MIRIENGKKSYDGRVIWENLNLTFSESGIYCLMGPSGQGKTTLLRCLAGLETLDGGTIHGLSDARISMVFQEDRLIPELTAAANLKLVGVKEPAALAAGDPSGGMPGSAGEYLLRRYEAPGSGCESDGGTVGDSPDGRAVYWSG